MEDPDFSTMQNWYPPGDLSAEMEMAAKQGFKIVCLAYGQEYDLSLPTDPRLGGFRWIGRSGDKVESLESDDIDQIRWEKK